MRVAEKEPRVSEEMPQDLSKAAQPIIDDVPIFVGQHKHVAPADAGSRREQIRAANEERRLRGQNDQQSRRNNHRRDHDDGPSPIGFGNDIPAFMLIEINIGNSQSS